jgi:hypothetical protein
MKSDSELPANTPSSGKPLWQAIFSRPSTRLGRGSVWLAVAFVALFLVNAIVFAPSTVESPWRQAVLPFYALFMLACGLSAGIAGLVAVIQRGERSWLVWLAILLGLLVLLFLVGELLAPH